MAYLGRKGALAPLTSADIPDNVIAQSDIANDAVTGAKLANDIAISTSGAITTTGAFTSIGIDDNSNALAITIDSSENVGIGITTPSSYFSGASDLVIGNHTGNHGLTINCATDGNTRIAFSDGTSGTANRKGSIIYTQASDLMSFYTNDTLGMSINSSGVGIGTSSPAHPLNVTKEVASDYQVKFQNHNGAAQGLQVRIKGNDTATLPAFDVETWDTGTTYTSKFRVQRDGKVGIGEVTPTATLDVRLDTGATRTGTTLLKAESEHGDASDYTLFEVKNVETGQFFKVRGDGLQTSYMTTSDNNFVMNLNPLAGSSGLCNMYIKADSAVFTGYHYFEKADPTILYTEDDTIPDGKEIGDVKTQGETFEMGDVVVVTGGKATKCTAANATNVAGIISGHPMPGGRWLSNNKDDIATEEHAVELACVGDSQDWNKTVDHYLTGFKVCNENGAISSGDLLCSAAKTGYLMKQTGTSITSKTVGKSMDDVTFDSDGNASGVYGFIYSG